MGRDTARKLFARAGVTLALAAATSIGLAAGAGAVPADRGGDAVVLDGSALPALEGVAPGKVVAYSWVGRWKQVPVQIDERHTIDVRQLYPPENLSPYVGDDGPDFDLEVYADPETRSGADADAGFDADDELAFMGRDTGRAAPGRTGAPGGVVPSSAVKVKVKDPLGGKPAFVYLFKAKGNPDQSAGKDYVEYEMKLTGLAPGQTIRDGYGYYHSTNPEDSTVTTAKYQLHSFDRWMEDELRVKAPGASGADILDREVAQATLFFCGRSEYTFSGRWTEDTDPSNDGATDDEGTYIAAIDGPVRAIRSYMGANSGPYVQREHVYYADHELNTVFLRVHPMLDLYEWTDYSEAALGMTYRDMNNTEGVTVDGQPDTLVPTTEADVANGAYGWQQLSGPQGTVSTVVGADTDIPNAKFGNYYLDDLTPTAPTELQCGGDRKSIGASGFGILGPVTPNTDPRLGAYNNLTVKRTRYFGGPAQGVAAAEDYTARVTSPLTGSAAASPMKKGAVRVRVKLVNRKVKARRGKKIAFRLKVINRGNFPVVKAKVCVSARGLTRRRCARVKNLGIGKRRTVVVRSKVRKHAKGRRLKLRLAINARSGDYKVNRAGSGPAIRLMR